jgi:Zn-dependent protease with chaperone function
MFNLTSDSAWTGVRQGVLLPLLVCAGLSSHKAESAPAAWFPDAPTIRHYAWLYQPCAGCVTLAPRPEWARMVALAGLRNVRFFLSPDENNGPAYSSAPNVVLLSPSALKLEACQLAFVIGHEIVHIAQRHYDEDAIALSVLSRLPVNWTEQGENAM